MPLEKQVCSLKWSQKLRELGVKQESVWYWRTKQEIPDLMHFWPIWKRDERAIEQENLIAAFTIAELIELLGDKFGVLERFTHNGKFGAYVPRDIGTSATGEKVADVLAELLSQTYGSEGN